MYKILFVDDDPLILRRLHQVLDWTTLGFEILPDASDGLAALEIIKSQIPDVIICDINMPNMDGIQLTAQVQKLHPQVHCIILTVNDSFNCAQQALNIGVYHYLLKPIEPKKIEILIQKILKFKASTQSNQYASNFYNKGLTTEKMIRDKFLNWVVSGRHPLSEQQLTEKFSFYHLPTNASEFEIISIHINCFEKRLLSEINIDEQLETVSKCVEDTLFSFHDCPVFIDSFYHLNILLGTSPHDQSYSQNIRLICQSLRDELLFTLNLPVTIFFSRRYQGLQNIYRCYYDTKFLYKYTQEVMDMGIISFDDYIKCATANPIDFDQIRSNVLRQLRTGNNESLSSYVKQIFDTYAGFSESIESFNMLRIDLIMTGMMFLQETRTALTDIFDRYYDPLAEVMERDKPSECISFICAFFQQVLQFSHNIRITSGQRLAEKCAELAAQNVSNPDLNVRWLASLLYINENYLSRQFHKEYGIPLIKYINIQKIETAKRYLDDGCTNLQQVAKKAGFTDSLYFSKCFKKHFGLSPSKYLERKKY